MKTSRVMNGTKANALRRKREMKMKRLRNLRNNILLASLAFIGFIFTMLIEVNGFTEFGVFSKLGCLAVLAIISYACLSLSGGKKKKVA